MQSKSPKVFLFVLRFEGVSEKWWTFKQMGRLTWKKELTQKFGFFKMMGTGSGNGFGLVPDFGTYIWIVTTDSLSAFLTTEPIPGFLKRLKKIRLFEMSPTKSHGLWNKKNPFENIENQINNEDFPLISVITRGSIKRSMWWKFWKYVPEVSRQIPVHSLFSVGMGELPLVEQATFSIWSDENQMKSWAYQNASHRKVIDLTRKLGWYEEELFARFKCREIHL